MDSGTGYSRIELEESYPVMGLTSLEVLTKDIAHQKRYK